MNICKSVDFGKLGLEFHIFGAGAEKEDIMEFISRNPDRGIVYNGVVKREEIPAMLKRYDAALIPLTKNIYGAVPSKIYEAMAAGLPIIFSGEGEGARIIQENKLGWVNHPTDEAAKPISGVCHILIDEIREGNRTGSNHIQQANQIGKLYVYLKSL